MMQLSKPTTSIIIVRNLKPVAGLQFLVLNKHRGGRQHFYVPFSVSFDDVSTKNQLELIDWQSSDELHTEIKL